MTPAYTTVRVMTDPSGTSVSTGSWSRTVPKKPPRTLLLGPRSRASARPVRLPRPACRCNWDLHHPGTLGDGQRHRSAPGQRAVGRRLADHGALRGRSCRRPLRRDLRLQAGCLDGVNGLVLRPAPRTCGHGNGLGALGDHQANRRAVPDIACPPPDPGDRTVPAGTCSSNCSVTLPRAISAALRPFLASSRVPAGQLRQREKLRALGDKQRHGLELPDLRSPSAGLAAHHQAGRHVVVENVPGGGPEAGLAEQLLRLRHGLVGDRRDCGRLRRGPCRRTSPPRWPGGRAMTRMTTQRTPRRRGLPSRRVRAGVAAARARAFSSSLSALRWARLLSAGAAPAGAPASNRAPGISGRQATAVVAGDGSGRRAQPAVPMDRRVGCCVAADDFGGHADVPGASTRAVDELGVAPAAQRPDGIRLRGRPARVELWSGAGRLPAAAAGGCRSSSASVRLVRMCRSSCEQGIAVHGPVLGIVGGAPLHQFVHFGGQARNQGRRRPHRAR